MPGQVASHSNHAYDTRSAFSPKAVIAWSPTLCPDVTHFSKPPQPQASMSTDNTTQMPGLTGRPSHNNDQSPCTGCHDNSSAATRLPKESPKVPIRRIPPSRSKSVTDTGKKPMAYIILRSITRGNKRIRIISSQTDVFPDVVTNPQTAVKRVLCAVL